MSDWNWTEPTDEEFDARRKDETWFKIFHIVDGKKITDYKFWAVDDEGALSVLADYAAEHDDNIEYYYGSSGYYLNHKQERFDDMEEMHEAYEKEEKTKTDYRLDDEDFKFSKLDVDEFRRDSAPDGKYNEIISRAKSCIAKLYEMIENVQKNVESQTVKADIAEASDRSSDKYYDFELSRHALDDAHYNLKQTVSRIMDEHAYSESWNLYNHMLDDLEYNLPILIKTHHGIPNMCVQKAEDQIKCGEADIECENGDAVYAIGSKIWEDELNRLLDAVRCYKYYENFGIVAKDKFPEEFLEKHKDDIPKMPGMYDAIDYKKLDELSKEKWNYIWNWMKENGQCLWD